MTETQGAAGSVRVSLASWLLERVADDEEDALERLAQSTGIAGSALGSIADDTWRWHMTRKLAECAARRQIIELHEQRYNECATCGSYAVCDEDGPGIIGEDYPCRTLRLLATPYASEPGYRAEWAV